MHIEEMNVLGGKLEFEFGPAVTEFVAKLGGDGEGFARRQRDIQDFVGTQMLALVDARPEGGKRRSLRVDGNVFGADPEQHVARRR